MIRYATVNDAQAVLEIYTPYVMNTAISFEYDAPSIEEMKKRIENTLKTYPYLVFEDHGEIVGYAYAGAFRTRKAYQYSVEVSVYVKEDHKKQGIGKALYLKLENELKLKEFHKMYAVVTTTERQNDDYLTNDSLSFHKAMGYIPVGELKESGYKFQQYYGICILEKNL